MKIGLVEQLRRAFSAEERPAYARRKPVQHILFVAIPTGLVFSVLNLLGGHYQLALVEIIVMGFMLPPVLWLVKRDDRIGVCENITMVAAVIMFTALLVTGGKAGAGSNWIFVYPFVAFYINDQQRAWLWIGLFFLIMLAHEAAADLGIMDAFYSPAQLSIFPVTFLFYSLIAYTFNRIRNQYEGRLEARVKQKTTELRRSLEELRRHALYDGLTGLPNRYLFEDRLKQAISVNERESCPLCVAVIDLDRFQQINNVLGHDKGDEVLKQMAGRIVRQVRASDTVARVGGDTFALILPKTDQDTVQLVARKVLLAMDEPFIVHGDAVEMTAGIGIAVAPLHGSEPEVLLQRADLAMRQAKENPMGTAMIYDQQQDPYSLRKLMLFGKLRKAISSGQLTLVYQPKIDLESMRIDSVEALVRWQDEEEGFISPAEFIPMAEQTGIINPLSDWVLEEAARQAVAWKRAGYQIPIAVNLSPRNLLNPTLVADIKALLARHDLDCSDICLEVTETALMTRPETALAILTELSQMGVCLSIDDFGTGYSSLAYLKKIPVDELKIDQSFVFDMLKNKTDLKIVESTVELAHGLGLKVVAEGVEEEEVLMKLKAMGVDKAQGYFMSRPLAASDFQVWLAESPWGLSTSASGIESQAG